MLNLVGRCVAGELQMLPPAFVWVPQVGENIGAVEYITGATGVAQGLMRRMFARRTQRSAFGW